MSLQQISLGVAYAIWSGLGTVGAVFVGEMVWQESLGPARLIGLIVIGVGVLNVFAEDSRSKARTGTGRSARVARNRAVDPCGRRLGQNGPKCVGRLHLTVEVTEPLACEHKEMLTPCPECGHKLWSEVGSLGAFRMVVFSDDEEESDTYTEQVTRCPGCGLWLYALAIKPSDVARHG